MNRLKHYDLFNSTGSKGNGSFQLRALQNLPVTRITPFPDTNSTAAEVVHNQAGR